MKTKAIAILEWLLTKLLQGQVHSKAHYFKVADIQNRIDNTSD